MSRENPASTSAQIEARYRKTGVTRYDGNPFIEALPKMEENKIDFLTSVQHFPPVPTPKLRASGEVVRLAELSTIGDLVVPFPEFQKIGLQLSLIMREAYVSRNPLTSLDRQRRVALASRKATGPVPFPSNWKSTAKGHVFVAVSGMGKTTYIQAFLLGIPQVIKHSSFQGTTLEVYQVTYVVLRVSHDATLKSLCLQFFKKIDKLLGTSYLKQAQAARNIALMVHIMNEVATAVSIGFLVIDEVQNLKAARTANATFMLNLFSEIIEELGISLLVVGTPAMQSIFEGSVRNIRKIASSGETVLSPMDKSDGQWQEYTDALWDYTYLKHKPKLTKEIRNAWYAGSAGNSAFTTLLFYLAQSNEISGNERLSERSFERVRNTEMAFLQPAISALLSKKPEALLRFDDLITSEKYTSLRSLLSGPPQEPDSASMEDEFEDLAVLGSAASSNDVQKRNPRARKAPSTKKGAPKDNFDPPMEDPL